MTPDIAPATGGLTPLPLPLPAATTTTTTTASLVRLMIQPDVNLPLLLLLSIAHLDFEYRKLVVILFKHCFKSDEAFRDYCCAERLPVLDFLLEGYTPARRGVCVNCHNMLEECVTRDPRAVDRLLRSKFLASFFESYVLSTDFEVQSKALALLSRALKQYPKTTAKFLKDPVIGADFFARYNAVLSTGNYVSTVQFLSLLSDLLMVRKNRKVMVAYVSEKANLMVIMKLLRHKSASIAYEAFHVFKIFVANPVKPDRVLFVFTQNSKKLIKFMKKFQRERDADEPDFAEERQRVIDSLKELATEAKEAVAAAGGD
jgi:calcium binding protein 39